MNVTIGALPRRPIALGPRAVLCAALVWLLLAVTITELAGVATRAHDSAPPPTAPTAAAATGSLDALPMAWVANTGQTDAAVRYLAQGLGYAAFLTDTEAVVRFDDAVVRLGFAGASTAPTLRTAEPLAATVSSFTGSDRSAWQSAAPTAEVVRYDDLWPGIDATFRGSGTHLEWDYHVASGADPSTAGTTVADPGHVAIDGDRATLAGASGALTLMIPAVWQILRDGTRVARDASWVLDGDTLRVVPGDWDPSLPGVIDPTLDWSTYLGGGPGGDGHDRFAGIAIDDAGNAFVTGSTSSFDFPTTSGAFDTTHEGGNGDDAFVAKIDPTGGALVFSTFLGGSGDDRGADVAVDATGNVYVVANTADGATDWPTTAGAFDTTANGGFDAAVTKLDPTGGSLLYSTLLGTAALDQGTGVAVDSAGNAYVTGWATDTANDYPTTPGAFDTTANGGRDAFVTTLDSTGSALVFSTLLGGSSSDEPSDLALDSSGRATITGTTFDGSPDYPTTPGAYDTTHNGTYDVFVTRLNATGSTLEYSTLIGAATNQTFDANDFASRLALDGAGNAYVTGQTAGAFPTTPGAYDTTNGGQGDAFVTELDATGSSLVFSTFLGGSGQDSGEDIALDPTGNVYVTGITPDAIVDFPTTPGAYDTVADGIEAFVTKLDPTGSTLDYSTRIGGPGTGGFGIAVDAAGDAYITGSTQSIGFPTTAGAFDTSHNGGNDGFVTKFNTAGSALDYSTLLGGKRGNGSDGVTGIAADPSGVYVAGTTDSNYFPTTAGAFDTSPNGGGDIFVAKLDPSGGSLIYSTVLGGSARDFDRFVPIDASIAIDASGHAYVTGSTEDAVTDFPTTAGAFDTSQNGGFDVFVTRLNPTGTALDFSTFLGGAAGDVSNGIAVDAAGSAYVTGFTIPPASGAPFPTTPGASDTSIAGFDAFITKLTPAGDALAYSTLLGGPNTDSAEDIAVDADGNAYVTGVAEVGFTVTPGAYDTTHNGTTVPDGDGGFIIGRDAFVSKLNATGTALVYSTYLGGSANGESGKGIAVDASGNVSVTGFTSSTNYPTTPGAFDTTQGGSGDAFVTRLNPSGSGLIFSTLLGGSGSDSGYDIAVDAAGSSYITGQTSATDYPVTPGAFDTTNGGLGDAFLTRLDPSGSGLAYSTFIGGSQSDAGNALAMTSLASVVVGGSSFSADFATTPVAYDVVNQNGLGAGFVARFDLSTVPGAPTIMNATAGHQSATVSWTAPASDGGSAIIGYVVTPYVGYVSQGPQYFVSTATTQTVTGLTNGTTYRFRVRAWNAIGVSGFSTATNPVTPATTVPGTPTIGAAVPGDGQATVSWTAPASDGGSAIIGYVVTPYVGYVSQGPQYFVSTATTQTVTGLTNGTTYRFRVRAWNAIGVSGFSTATNPVTPTP